jgi:exopolyphosphatase/guanosine-5'-triphosphate,3'-diphosphate pyrophosphatase
MPRFAAIDVGSNALRLVLVEAKAAGEVEVVASHRAPVRLGQNVFVSADTGGGRIPPSTLTAACEALRKFREILDEEKVDLYRAVATSAVREAENGSLLVERARREAGIELDVIEGAEEARLVRLALVGRLSLGDKRALLVDLGGGSTELSLLERGKLRAARSLPIGTVRLLEAFLKGGGAVEPVGAELAREYVERQLREVLSDIKPGSFDVVVGTGGNFETLAQLCPAPLLASPTEVAASTKGKRIEVPALDVTALRALAPKLAALTPDERRVQWGLRPDRADVIAPAAEIVLGVAKAYKFDRVLTPGIGLKEGVVDELVEKHFDVWDYGGEATATIESATRLGKRYAFDEEHGTLVARLASELFDQLRPLHRLGDRDRLLLHTAALLHDVGDFIRYEGHHRHTYYVLVNSEVLGLSPRERDVMANIARYHRKSLPDTAHPNFRDLDRDDRARVRALAGLLRIADALDREHAAKITAVRAVLEKGRMRLHLTGSADRQLEEWTVARKSELFREVFDLAVEVVR